MAPSGSTGLCHWSFVGEYTEPADDGTVACPDHPDAGRFLPHIGCQLPHDDGPEQASPGEGERMCAEAARRNLPDAFEVEARMWQVWRTSTKRAEMCAATADALTAGDEGPPNYDLAAKFEAAAAKWMDVSVKAGKLATGPVLHRERMAELERRARMLKGGKGGVH